MRVLQGTICQDDRKFSEMSRNKQCTAIASVAVSMCCAKHPVTWSSSDVDHCLELGDELYRASILSLNDRGAFIHQYLRPAELLNQRCVAESLQVEFNVLDEEICGTLMGASDAAFLSYELEEGLEKLCTFHQGGVITCGQLSMSLVKVGLKYYFFDSHKRGENGLFNERGKAVLITFDNVGMVRDHLRSLFGQRNEEYTMTPLEVRRLRRNAVNGSERSANRVVSPARIQCENTNNLNLKKGKKKRRMDILKNAREAKKCKNEEEKNSLEGSILSSDISSSHDGRNTVSMEGVNISSDVSRSYDRDNIPVSNQDLEFGKRELPLNNGLENNTNGSMDKENCSNVSTRYKTKLEESVDSKKRKFKEYRSTEKYKEREKRRIKEMRELDEKQREKNLANVKKRLQIPEVKCKNLANVKKRLQIPEVKCKNLADVKKRLENPEVKSKNLANVKERLKDPEIKSESLARNKKYMNELRSTVESFRENENKKRLQNKRENAIQKNSAEGIIQKYKATIKEGPTNVCICCGQLFFSKSVKGISENDRVKFGVHFMEHMKIRKDVKICFTCWNYVRKNMTPPTALINGLELSPIPEELANINSGEERLVSGVLPFAKVKELGVDQQYGLQGSCILVPVDVHKVTTSLPRPPSESATIQVAIMRRMSDTTPQMRVNILKERVEIAVKFLVETELYKKHCITLREGWEREFDRDIKEILENEKVMLESTEGNGNINKWEESLTEEERAIEMQATLLTSTHLNNIAIKIAPGEGKVPMSLTKDPDVDVLAFPTVYGGKARNFRIPLTPVQIAKADVRSENRRVAMNVALLFFRFCIVRIYRLMSKINIALRKKISVDSLKVSDVLDSEKIQKLINHDEGYQVLSVDRNAPPHWLGIKKIVFAMLRQVGCPTFFLTLSAAETMWPELLVILFKVMHKRDISEEEALKLTWPQKVELIKNDSITCARYFDLRFTAMMEVIVHENGPFSPYEVNYHFYRYEIQKRGSIHAHVIIWIKDAPTFDPNSEDSRKKCVEFIDKFITCRKDESLGITMNRQYHKHRKNCQRKGKDGKEMCRFDFPRSPMRATNILSPLSGNFSSDEIKEYKALYKTIVSETDKIARANENCSFDEYLKILNISEEDYILALRSNLTKHKVYVRRDVCERYINVYNRIILFLWDANSDLQFILDPYATIGYVNDYLTKSNLTVSRLLNTLHEKLKKGDSDLFTNLRSYVNTFINNTEISAQEVCLHLLSIPMSRSSVGQVFINTSLLEKRVKLLKSKAELEFLHEMDPSSQDIFVPNMCDRYVQRPDILEKVCLAEFAAMWTFSKKKTGKDKVNDQDFEEDGDLSANDEKEEENVEADKRSKSFRNLPLKDKSGFLTIRKKRKIIRYCRFDKVLDENNYYREQLMLFTAWRVEPCAHSDLQNEYDKRKKEIRENRKVFCPFDDIFDDLEGEEPKEDSECEDDIPKIVHINELQDEADIAVEIPALAVAEPLNRVQTFVIPKLMNDEDYLSLMTKLNVKQKRLMLDVVNVMKTNPKDQRLVFVSGAAGVGKSVLIEALTQSLSRYWVHHIDNNPDDLFLMLLASTGRAAYGIRGSTIHQAFQFGYILQKELASSRKLSSDVRNTLFSKYRHLKMIIIDEASLVGATMLQAINRALQDIFGNNLLFGGISVFMFGDLNQLKPVSDRWLFQKVPDLRTPDLWSHFVFFEMDQIMRQQEDAKFATALTNLALGNTTEEENQLFKSREMSKLHLTVSEVMNGGAIALYYRNHDVDVTNQVMLASMPGDTYFSDAYDEYAGKDRVERRKEILAGFKNKHHKDTQGLMSRLALKEGGKYVLSSNVDVSDGLANGVPCVLKHIVWGELESDKSLVPLRLYMEFEHSTIGENIRSKLKQKIISDKVNNLQWIPIERIVKIIPVSVGSTARISRNQFPIKPAFAMTIHTSQGTTQNKIVVKLVGLTRREKYTALSRVRSIKDLFIEDKFEPPLKANPDKDVVVKEMNRLRESCAYNFKLVYPDNNPKSIQIVYHNIRSLVKYIDYVKSDFNYTNCDIILLAETRTLITSCINMNNYAEISRIDGVVESNHAYGMIVYAKTHLKTSITVVYQLQMYSKVGNDVFCVEIIGMKICHNDENFGLISIYKSPKCKADVFISALSEAVENLEKTCCKNIFIVGDFNINYFILCKNREMLLDFMERHNFVMLNQKEPTTDTSALLDMCFGKLYTKNCHITESVVSDHKPLWFSV